MRQWYFEVWNEPNLEAFWKGTQTDYFTLYQRTAEAINRIYPVLRVGGPATAANAWIGDFLAFCEQQKVSLDFVSTHHYPTDAVGKPGDDTVAHLAASHIGVFAEHSSDVREQVGELPLYYTEWCTSSNPRDTLHDDPYAAAYILKTVMQQQGLVQGYSYWTFSDIFEENDFPSAPFHGGFGLMNIHGVAKPSWRAQVLAMQEASRLVWRSHSLDRQSVPTGSGEARVDARNRTTRPQKCRSSNGLFAVDLDLPAQSVAAVRLCHATVA